MYRTSVLLAAISFLAVGRVALADFSDAGAIALAANWNSRSVSLADIDNDSDLDLLFQGAFGSQQLYRNNLIGSGILSFTNISNQLPAGLDSGSWSAGWADINGDHLIDVFVGQSNLGVTGDVLINQGAGGFTNGSASLGLDDPGFHQNVAWNDIDNDNDLDLILAMEGPTERHEIYLQADDGTFDPVGALVGFQEDPGTKAYGMAIGDTDGDGDLDIYISTCRGNNNIRNHFYENQLVETGSLGFIDIADTNGTQFMTNSYGTEFQDFDNDGDLDLFMTGADSQPSKLWRNDGGNQFTDVDTLTGVPLLSDTSGDLNGSRAVDYDNDGDLDLFFHDNEAKNGKDNARKLYRNDGGWSFTDVTIAEGLHWVNEGSYDSAWGDLDRDGDQDLLATTDSNTSERVFLSDESGNGNHWLYVELAGAAFNTSGVGATVYATMNTGTPDEVTLRREANTNAGTFNQSDTPVHFGLGAEDAIDELRVVWTDGRVHVIAGVSADQYLTVAYADMLQGDFNGDGLVDAADYTVWRDADGATQIGHAADANGDGAVNSADYDLWVANYGQSLASIAVPEPSSVASLLIALGIHMRRRRG
ncbi:FG-GAP repeat protein [Planctomycetes bacterium MalM25]|nr:FG-GAP repeat protein [Planctomycetes bacterium MalM25]